jgi:hypothetical protein
MIIYEGKCPFCHQTVRIPKAEEVHFDMILPQEEMMTQIKLLKEALRDALALIEEHPILHAHATRVSEIRSVLGKKDVRIE